mgnify:CR=1 FL=1
MLFRSRHSVVNWDGSAQTFAQHVYYFCRTDPSDELENAEWFALNSYRHCDGSATTKDEIVGWPELKADFQAVNFPGPILFGEYGCREYGFPTIDEFETQRTWLQAEALYSPDYNDVFAGGFAFEYSAEKKQVDDGLAFEQERLGLAEPASVWPYYDYAKLQYGIGYFDPVDCVHDGGNDCEYIKYPEYEIFKEKMANAGATVRQQRPGEIPQCPPNSPSLSSFDWPSDSEDDGGELQFCMEAKAAANVATGTPTTAPVSSSTEKPTFAAITADDVTGEPSTTATTSKLTSSPTTEKVDDVDFPTDTGGGQSSQCSDHSSCADAGLVGDCCPTPEGVSLGCCDAPLPAPSSPAPSTSVLAPSDPSLQGETPTTTQTEGSDSESVASGGWSHGLLLQKFLAAALLTVVTVAEWM